MKKNIYKSLLALAIMGMLILLFSYMWKRDYNNHKLTLYGNIEIRQVDLAFRVQGTISKMLYEEGDLVKKGQLLASIDDKQYLAEYKRSLGEIQLNKALKSNAQSKYARHKPLCEEHTTSKERCDDLLNKKKETEASFNMSIAAAKYAKGNLEDSKIFAPCNGIIMTRVQEPGSIALPGQPIYTLAKTEPVWIRAYVPETNLGNIKYGMKTKVFTDTRKPNTDEKRKYTGWIGYISPVAEFTPKTVETTDLRTDLVYRIRVYIYEVDDFLRQGMPVTIEIDLKNNETRKKIRGTNDK